MPCSPHCRKRGGAEARRDEERHDVARRRGNGAADLAGRVFERVHAACKKTQRRAVPREAERDRLPDPAARARDDDVPAVHVREPSWLD